MLSQMKTAFSMTLATLAITGLAYPLFVTALAQALFPRQAAGSFVSDASGRAVGSELIGQAFAKPEYFQPRPSAAGEKGWDATSSSPSNLGPTSKALRDRVTAAVARLRAENPDARGDIPGELVAASASGLDPHLSPSAAAWQIPRIAAARGVSPSAIESMLEARTEGRTFGLLGEPRVNVLLLNLDLDQAFRRQAEPR